MSSWTDYFDWYDLLVNQVAGNGVIFIFVSIAIITFAALRFKFNNMITLTILCLWSLLMSVYFQAMLPITVFIIGFLFYGGLSKLIKD